MLKIIYKKATEKYSGDISQFVLKVFDEFVAPTFNKQGCNSFAQYVSIKELSKRIKSENHFIILAISNNQIIGIIEVRNQTHISLLFVDASFQKQGIAKNLIKQAFSNNMRGITVQSAPNAVAAYKKMGFKINGPEFLEDGMRQQPMIKSKKEKIYRAQAKDIPLLTRHHHLMVKEIFDAQNKEFDETTWSNLDNSYADKLNKQLNNSCFAFILELENEIVASGAVTFIEAVPLPNDTNYKIACIHSIFTDKKYRQKDYAKKIIEKLIQFIKSRGIGRIELIASSAGISLYKKLGFKEITAMRLYL